MTESEGIAVATRNRPSSEVALTSASDALKLLKRGSVDVDGVDSSVKELSLGGLPIPSEA